MAAKCFKEGALKADMSYQLNPTCSKPACRAFMPPIRKTKAFKTVYSCGSQAVNAFFVMYAMANDTNANRLGVTVSKKVGKAVVRNRVKRLVKESCRLNADKYATGYDIVVVARPAVGALPREGSFRKVDKALESLFGRLKLLEAKTNG